jgi:hypothetical protein
MPVHLSVAAVLVLALIACALLYWLAARIERDNGL